MLVFFAHLIGSSVVSRDVMYNSVNMRGGRQKPRNTCCNLKCVLLSTLVEYTYSVTASVLLSPVRL
jgi:hypothetical protein